MRFVRQILTRHYAASGTALIGHSVRSMSVGWGNDVYAFALRLANGEVVHRVLRIYGGANAHEKAAVEGCVLEGLWKHGFPVPWVEAVDERMSGRPSVLMELIEGETLDRFIAPGKDDAELLRRFAACLAALHRLEWQRVLPERRVTLRHLSETGTRALFSRNLEAIDAVLPPDLASASVWLSASFGDIEPRPDALLHLDYHPGNVICRAPAEGGSSRMVVIDWAGSAIADPRLDVAGMVTALRLSSSGEVAANALAAYEGEAGVTLPDMDYFEAVSCFSRLSAMWVAVEAEPGVVGLRGNIRETLVSAAAPFHTLYERFVKLTGRRLATVEALLERLR